MFFSLLAQMLFVGRFRRIEIFHFAFSQVLCPPHPVCHVRQPDMGFRSGCTL